MKEELNENQNYSAKRELIFMRVERCMDKGILWINLMGKKLTF